MTGSAVRLEVSDAEVRQMLASQATLGTADLMPRLGEYFQEATQRRFATQTAPDGTPWVALSPKYARRKKYAKDRVLTLRGYLRRSIAYHVDGPDSAEVGTGMAYAAIHQFGGTIQQAAQSRQTRYRSVAGRVLFAKSSHKKATTRWVDRPAYQTSIPARPFMGIGDDEAAVQRIVQEWAKSQGNLGS